MKEEKLLRGDPIAGGTAGGEVLVSADPINFYKIGRAHV